MKLSSRGALLPTRGFQRVRHRLAESVLPTGSSIWTSTDGVLVTTQLSDMPLPQSEGKVGPTWLIEVSHKGGRPSDDTMRRVVECFDMPAFEEDNHFPGMTRALFCPIDPDYRNVCDCKLTEVVHVEADGYTWSDDGTARRRLAGIRALTAALNDRQR